jgi:predicted  nucleic acid-binding Zn-ribbon protein
VPIDLEILKTERDKLKDGLRELEVEQRKVESELKRLRQREIRTKREIEALSTLIELADTKKPADDDLTDKLDAAV